MRAGLRAAGAVTLFAVLAGCTGQPPPDARRCTAVAGDVDDVASVSTSGGVRAGPLPSLREAVARGTDETKLWVAPVREPRSVPDARIRVTDRDGRVRDATYVRPAAEAARADDGSLLYPGLVRVPYAEGARLRVTVAIGGERGCFDVHV